MILGDLALLPDLPPDADQYRDKIVAAGKEDKPSSDVPRGTSDPLAADPLAFPSLAPKFAPGTKVRDMLSGQTGTVAAPPGEAGVDYGEVVFVKMDADGATHPLLSSFLEVAPTAAAPSPLTPTPLGAPAAAPAPAALPEIADGSPAPGSPIPDKPSVTNAARHRRSMNARLTSPVVSKAPASIPVVAAANDDPIITNANDARAITYSAFLKQIQAKPGPSHSDALSIIGYVPANWDRLVARLLGDGVMLRSKKGAFDVASMIRSNFSQSEIRYILGCKGVPMYALDRAFIAIKAEPSTAAHAFTPEGIAAFRKLYNLGAEIAEAAVIEEMNQFSAADMPKAWLKADMPSKPMPTEDPGNGMSWAWAPDKQEWYKAPKAG